MDSTKPKSQPRDEFELFQAHFDQLLDPAHELIQLARMIDWAQLDAEFVDCYRPDIGAPAKAIRLMVGLHYLKYTFDESDESVADRWVENPYWQYFCGYTHMQHECPIHPTSMTKWRNRVGAERLEGLLKETIRLAVREKHLPKRDLKRVTVDTTVQEKNITYPTDSKLLYKAIVKLGDAAKSRGIDLRQSYVRVGKKATVMAGRYAHAKQFKRMRRRSAIEPKIGHLKSDHRMGRCFLARLAGDAINAILAAAGSNLRKLLGLLRSKAGRLVFALLNACRNLIAPCPRSLTAHHAIARMGFSGTTIYCPTAAFPFCMGRTVLSLTDITFRSPVALAPPRMDWIPGG